MALREFLNGHPLIKFYGTSMKSRDAIKLLERLKLKVVYDFDRLEEGTPDTYSVSAPAEGFELQFDEGQVLETIWCYVRQRGSFVPIDVDCIGVYIPKSFEDARRHAEGSGLPFKAEVGANAYVRIDDPKVWVHYEFHDGHLTLVTIMRPWE
jgi:hypothetical protein